MHLLERTGIRRHETSRHKNEGTRKRQNQNYALTGLIRCAHCHARFIKSDNPNDLTYLWGHNKAGIAKPVYMHKDQTCTIRKKSVQQFKLHDKFLQLVQILITEISSSSQHQKLSDMAYLDEEEKRIERALANINLMLMNGMVDFMTSKDQIHKLKQEQKRFIEMRTHQIGEQSNLIIINLQEIVEKWHESSDDERYLMVSRMFEWIVYDLDTEKITDYKMIDR